ncbi:ABC transporter [Enterococcus sp. AZ103]|uniref:ABC transporter n=1 Tax=Enterococcus sp. AZ103 TaxID=2774628 RepID=UPI003F275B90
MNRRLIQKLVGINILYTNPKATKQARDKGKKGAQVIKSLMWGYIMSGGIFLVVYGLMMIFIDFAKMPGNFTYYMALFALIGFTQGLSAIFNVFFDSRDLMDYLPLPISQGAIFIAKFLAVGLTIVPFILPLLILFFLGSLNSLPIVLAVVWSILLFVIFFCLLFGICTSLIFAFARTKFFQQHKKTLTSLMLGFSMIISVAGIIMINATNSSSSMTAADRPALAIFMPFYYVAATPFSMNGLLSIAGTIVVLLLLFILLKKMVVPSLYQQMSQSANDTPRSSRKHKKQGNLVQIIRSYNLQLLKNPNLVMQVMSATLIMPVVFIISFSLNGGIAFDQLPNYFFGVFFLVGLFLAAMMTTQSSFVANMISLDRENFLFIASLPISLKGYLKEKFRLGLFLQCLMVGLVTILSGVVFKLTFVLIVSTLVGGLLGSYLFSLSAFAGDYRHLNLNWNNISQLFSRGGGSFRLMFRLFGTMFAAIIVVALYTMIVIFTNGLMIVNLLLFLVVAAISAFWIWRNQKNFWQRLSN